MKLKGFNANDHEDMQDFSAMPAGEYVGKITDSEEVETKNKNGHFLKLTFQVTEGKFKGRKVWTNLNLDNPSAEAMDIANRELGSIMKACGKVAVDESEDLHGIEMNLKVGIKKATANYAETNEIKNYKALDGVGVPSNPSSAGNSPGDTQKKKSRVSFD